MRWKSAILIAAACLFVGSPARAGLLDPNGFASLGTLNLAAGNYTINTSGSAPVLQDSMGNTLFTGTTFNQGGSFNPTVAVFDFSSITVASGAVITAGGANPVALLSRGDATLGGSILANGSDGGNGSRGSPGLGGAGGPGGASGGDGTTGNGNPGDGPGGGPGSLSGLQIDSFGVGAGYGGKGGNPGLRPVFGPTYGNLHTTLTAGSGGGGSGANLFSLGGGGGGGGGGVELGALGSIALGMSASLHADGGNGGSENIIGYLGGGGSGGGLFLHAPSITVDSFSSISAGGGGVSGAGGRILILTDSGDITNNGGTITAGATVYGEAGVVEFGKLGGVTTPEPTSALLIAAGAVVLVWRRRL